MPKSKKWPTCSQEAAEAVAVTAAEAAETVAKTEIITKADVDVDAITD